MTARVPVGLDSPHAERQLRKAPKDVERSLLRQAALLSSDPSAGTFISLQRVPKKTRDMWRARIGEFESLFKLDLPAGWRTIYTVLTCDETCSVLVIEVVDHKEYELLMGY
jgi:hypothetical protein